MSELIDRQALRSAHGLGTDCADCKQDARSCQYDRDFSRMDFCEWIDDAPTIDAVPVVHGRWKDYPDCGVTACSACGWSIEECFYDPTTLKPYPYCPNCGARMDGERRER